ncbi:MAG: thioredoxin [Candidatus Bathyarchaeia archaeon]
MPEDEELEKIKEKLMRQILSGKQSQREPEGILKEGEITHLDSSNIDEALKETSKPILIDFWAAWCSPCKMMEPVLEKMACSYKGRAFFAKVNIDRNRSIAQRYGVMSIPNFLIFKDGKAVERVIGAVGRQRLESKLRKFL